MKRWSPNDDTQLLQLLQDNKLDPSDLSATTIEAVRVEYYPDRPYNRFAPLYRNKIRKWNIEQSLAGKRKGTNKHLAFHSSSCCCLLLKYFCLLFLIRLSPATADKQDAKKKEAAQSVSSSSTKNKRTNDQADDSSAQEDEEYTSGGEDEQEEEDDEIEESEEVDDDAIDEVAEELELLETEASDHSTMKPLIYSWLDESGRQRLTLDFLVIGLAETDFTPRVSRNGMTLDLGFVVPEVFFSPKRLSTASDGRISGSHAKHTAFTKAVHVCKASTSYDIPLQVWQRVKLPFKVECDFVAEGSNRPGYELVAFPHPNKNLRLLGQALFVFTVELVSVIKPRKLNPGKARKSAVRMIASPNGGEDDDDSSDCDESNRAGRSNVDAANRAARGDKADAMSVVSSEEGGPAGPP